MGFDISNHPVDVELIQRHIIPYIRGEAPLSDALVARAARINCIRHRANAWGLGLLDHVQAMQDRQRKLGIMRTVRYGEPPGLLSRLLRRPTIYMTAEIEQITDLPGFDSDLALWGRPFFIVADEVHGALEALDRYLSAPDSRPETVDAIITDMLKQLDGMSDRLPAAIDPRVTDLMRAGYPLLAHVRPSEHADAADEAETAKRIRERYAFARTVFSKRNSDEILNYGEDDDRPAKDLAASLAFEVVNLAAQSLPGWMGRGHVWPTRLFEKIGVKVSHIFEPPHAVFGDLLRDMPALEQRMNTTIVENFCLGGYVPPRKMQAFVDLLTRHGPTLAHAWDDPRRHRPAGHPGECAADVTKIIEPATYALRHGFGFIEAAEIYSGILGG